MTEKPTPADDLVEYVVQVADEDPKDVDAAARIWRDITVKVPSGTKRPSIIQKALDQAGITATLTTQARALDPVNARIYSPPPPPPTPPLRFA